MNSFAGYHPIVLFVYYGLALFFTMFTSHPILLAASLAGAFLFYTLLTPRKQWMGDLVYYFFLFVLLAITNPLFSQNGETPLFFMNDQPVTLEALWYGAAVAGMIVAVLFWCKCYNLVLTTDKFLYLFGNTIPKLSLILSMALRFFPLIKQQVKKVNQAQKTMGMYARDSLWDKLLFQARVLDSVITWLLESSVDTADSMKARGYGVAKRSHFSIFRFEKRDGRLLGVLGVLAAAILAGWMQKVYQFRYYPSMDQIAMDEKSICYDAVAGALLLLPFVLEAKGKIQWHWQQNRQRNAIQNQDTAKSVRLV